MFGLLFADSAGSLASPSFLLLCFLWGSCHTRSLAATNASIAVTALASLSAALFGGGNTVAACLVTVATAR